MITKVHQGRVIIRETIHNQQEDGDPRKLPIFPQLSVNSPISGQATIALGKEKGLDACVGLPRPWTYFFSFRALSIYLFQLKTMKRS